MNLLKEQVQVKNTLEEEFKLLCDSEKVIKESIDYSIAEVFLHSWISKNF